MQNSTAQCVPRRSASTRGPVEGIPNCPLLTHEEEKELARLIASGNTDARNRLVLANLRLVVKIAGQFRGRGLGLEDLVGEGNLGLMRAAKEFDPQFGTRFSTYAAYWIKESIRHALINRTSTIRLPAHMIGLLTKWRRIERAILRERGERPDFEEIASILGLSERQKALVGDAQQALRVTVGGEITPALTTHASCNAPDRYPAGESVLQSKEEWQVLSKRFESLDERERTILTLHYGLGGQKPLTFTEIGRRLGVVREWVRKIEIRAIDKLRHGRSDQPIEKKIRRRSPLRRRSAQTPETSMSHLQTGL